MPEGLTRLPNQPPQTAMERHIDSLVATLRDGTYTRPEFANRVEAAMAHAFELERCVRELRQDNLRLEDALAVGMPKLLAYFDIVDLPSSIQRSYEWDFPQIRWRMLLEPFQTGADEITWRRIRRATYRSACKLFRMAFDNSFPKSPPSDWRF